MDAFLRHPTGVALPLPPGAKLNTKVGVPGLEMPGVTFQFAFFAPDDFTEDPVRALDALVERYRAHPESSRVGGTRMLRAPFPAATVPITFLESDRPGFCQTLVRMERVVVRILAWAKTDPTPQVEALVAGMRREAPQRHPAWVGRWRGERTWQTDHGYGVQRFHLNLAADGRANVRVESLTPERRCVAAETWIGPWYADARFLFLATDGGTRCHSFTCEGRVLDGGHSPGIGYKTYAVSPLVMARRPA